jgi:hypothetical protein
MVAIISTSAANEPILFSLVLLSGACLAFQRAPRLLGARRFLDSGFEFRGVICIWRLRQRENECIHWRTACAGGYLGA